MTAPNPIVRRRAGLALALFATLAGAAPASAQWTPVPAVTSTDLYSIYALRDTIVAGGDSVAWISTDAGASWAASTPVGVAPATVDALWLRDGRLWAGTSGQGVFTSDDLGASWQPRSDGLAGGLFGSHLYILSFTERRDTLYAGTGGAGVFARPLRTAGPWVPTGGQLLANQSGGVDALASDGARIVAAAGANGTAHYNDGGAPWTEVFLDGAGLQPGISVLSVVWTGTAWLVGTDHGVFRSPDGATQWEFAGLNLGSTLATALAAEGGRTFACVNRSTGGVFRWSPDDGTTWNVMETVPMWSSELALQGGRLWSARFGGLWYRDVSTLDVPAPAPRAAAFALRGPHPSRGAGARFAVGLEREGVARLELFDAGGRRVRASEHALAAGEHELAMDVTGVPPGVYHARLTAGGLSTTLRFVRLD